jgi:hypothetical protein
VIELDGRKNDGLREIVQELGAFIKECCVVFVAFNNEVLTLAKRKAAAKVFCNAANQE